MPAVRRARLLLVDRDLPSLLALRHHFALAGYDVDCAAGPAEGMRLLDRQAYDAIVTDSELRLGIAADGLTIAAHARRRNPCACVILLTRENDPVACAEAMRRGVDLCHTKSADLTSLADSVTRVRRGYTSDIPLSDVGVRPALGGGEGA